jgi:peptidyl-prolyl cis-trans isomerase D
VAREKGLQATIGELKSFIESLYPKDPQMALTYLIRAQRFDSEEAFIRANLYRMTLDKARSLYTMQAKTSLFELWQEYLLMEEKVNLSFVIFNAQDYTEKTGISDAEVSKYFEEHKEDYRIPNQVKYEYIAVNMNTLIADAATTEGEVLAYYEKNKNKEFKEERQVKVRLIMLATPPDITAEQFKEMERFADDTYTSLTVKGANFAALADRLSADPQNTKPELDADGKPTGKEVKLGGLLEVPWNLSMAERSPYGKTMVEEVVKLEQGQISRPLKGPSGICIIKAENVTPEHIIPFDKAHEQAMSAVKREKAQKVFQDKKGIIYAKYEHASTLPGLAKETGLEMKETELINEDSLYIPNLGSISRFQNTLSELKGGEMTEVLESTTLLAVMRLSEKVPTHIPDLGKIKEQVGIDAKFFKALVLTKKDADAFLKVSTSFDKMREEAEKNKYKFQTPEPFNHVNPPAELAGISNLPQLTVKSKEGTIRMSEITQRGPAKNKVTSYAVWCLKSKTPPDKNKFRQEIPDLQWSLVQTKQKMLLFEQLADMRNKLQYKVNPDFLKTR